MHLFVQKLWHRVDSVPLTQAGPEGTCSYIRAFSNLLHCGNNLVSNAKESKDTRRGLSVFWFTRTLLARIRSPFGDKTINLSLSLSHFLSASLCVAVDTKTGMCFFFLSPLHQNNTCKCTRERNPCCGPEGVNHPPLSPSCMEIWSTLLLLYFCFVYGEL